jgi:hypothetical protein
VRCASLLQCISLLARWNGAPVDLDCRTSTSDIKQSLQGSHMAHTSCTWATQPVAEEPQVPFGDGHVLQAACREPSWQMHDGDGRVLQAACRAMLQCLYPCTIDGA